MRITSKGQVTIPQDIRERYGLLPHTEVEFVAEGETVFLCKSEGENHRMRAWLDRGTRLSRHQDDHRRDHGSHARRRLTGAHTRGQQCAARRVRADAAWYEWSAESICGARRMAVSSSTRRVRGGLRRLLTASRRSTTSCRPASTSAPSYRGRPRSSRAKPSSEYRRAGGARRSPASRLLHRRPRGGRRHVAAHPRCCALPRLLPHRGTDRTGRLTATRRAGGRRQAEEADAHA